MTEIQNCLPGHARLFFIRLRNLKWEESRKFHKAKLAAARAEAAEKNVLRSGFQAQAEWSLAREHIGNLAFDYFDAAVETCTLYEIELDKRMSECIEAAIKSFLIVQQRNAISNSAKRVPGAVDIPLSSRQQLSENPGSLPRFNEILIALEKVRVESSRVASLKRSMIDSKANFVNEAKDIREGNRADVLNVLIASPSDVNDEREAVVRAIYDWNAINSHPDTINILLNPIRWETHSFPESGERPQALLNHQIVSRGDVLIGIFGARLGTPTGVAESGTIEEIEQFRQAGKYVALYFSSAPVPRDVDREQLDALTRFQEARKKDTKFEVFANATDLRNQVVQHLTGIVMSVAKPLRLGMWRKERDVAKSAEDDRESLESLVKKELREIEENRRMAEEIKEEAARWKPIVTIDSKVEGQRQINSIVLKSHLEFSLVEVSLLSQSGAKIHDYATDGEKIFSTGFSVPITHESLLKISNSSQSFIQFGTFQGSIRYIVTRKKDGVGFTGTVAFHAETVFISNTLWFKLTG